MFSSTCIQFLRFRVIFKQFFGGSYDFGSCRNLGYVASQFKNSNIVLDSCSDLGYIASYFLHFPYSHFFGLLGSK
jgi:hypothetical protein